MMKILLESIKKSLIQHNYYSIILNRKEKWMKFAAFQRNVSGYLCQSKTFQLMTEIKGVGQRVQNN